ncbi:MAG: hypothetical protein L6R19_20295 [Alphaproteobacteria bacterium]|nr:hypothetical protein [Alphaproteobacteria bacterium]
MSDDRPEGEKAALGADLVLPALAVALTAYFFVAVADLAWEAKANAVVIGVVLLALVALHVARVALRVWAGEASLGIAPLIEPRRTQGARLMLVALTALFVFLIPWLGVTLGLFLLTGALMVVLGAGSLRMIATVSATVAIVAYLLFIALLNSRLPRGPVEKLLAMLF